MVKAINKSQDIRHPTHNLQNDRKLVYDTNSTQMKMTNPYIFLDKEINILKKDIKENYESEVKEKEDFNNKDNSISKKKVDFVDERENLKNLKNNQKIKIVIDEKNLKSDLNNLTIPDKDLNKEDLEKSSKILNDGLYFEYISSFEKNEYDIHIRMVPDNQKKLFNIRETIDCFKGNFPKFVKISNITKSIGYFSYYNDTNSLTSLKIILSEISTILKDLNDIELFLMAIKNFLVQRVLFDEVYISLHHYTDKDNNFLIDKELVECFKKKLLFRWYKVLNTGNNERIMILYFKNTSQNVENPLKLNILKDSLYSIKVKNSMTYQIKKNIKRHTTSQFCRESNIYPLIVSLIQQEAEEGIKTGYCIEKLGSFDKEKIKNTKCNFVCSNKDLKGNVIENLKTHGITFDIDNSSSYKTLLKFESIISTRLIIEFKEYYYNIITVDKIEKLIDKDTSHIYYLVRIDDNHTLMISNVKGLNIKDQICEDFYKIYSKLEPHEDGNHNKKLLIPCFNKTVKNFYECPKLINDLLIKKAENDADIINLSEYNEISFEPDYEIDKSLKLNDFKDCILIKDEFLFGIININVLEENLIPAVYLNYISKTYWKEV